MSRAFVKEDSSSSILEEIAERQISPHPNYMTKEGFEHLKQRVDALAKARFEVLTPDSDSARHERALIDRDLRYYQARLQSAIVVEGQDPHADNVRFGAWVTLQDESGIIYKFRLVGEDEADAVQGLISWISPLAGQLLGKQVGDRIIWAREGIQTPVDITEITYSG